MTIDKGSRVRVLTPMYRDKVGTVEKLFNLGDPTRFIKYRVRFDDGKVVVVAAYSVNAVEVEQQ